MFVTGQSNGVWMSSGAERDEAGQAERWKKSTDETSRGDVTRLIALPGRLRRLALAARVQTWLSDVTAADYSPRTYTQ